jgi:hypothetical protein
MNCVGLCSRAEFDLDQFGLPVMDRRVIGDASEAALLKFFEISMGDTMGYRDKNTKFAEIPFNSHNKYQVNTHHDIFRELKRFGLRINESCQSKDCNEVPILSILYIPKIICNLLIL